MASKPQHKDRVWQVAVHPRLPLVASCSGDKTVNVYRGPDLELVKDLTEAHTRSVRSVSWKAIGAPTLAAGSFDAQVSIWTNEPPTWEFMAMLEGHENEVKGVAWSHDGAFLATCSRDKSVWIWEVDESNEDFDCVAVLQDHTQDVKHVVWHPSELLLASTSYDNEIRLWKLDDDEWICVSDLKGHESTVWGAAFEPAPPQPEQDTGEVPHARLASCSDDMTVRVWTRKGRTGGTQPGQLPSVARWDILAEEWEQECVLPTVHTDTIYAVDWSQHGIASVGADGRLAIYTFENNKWTVSKIVQNAHGVYEINTF
ncbi:putative cytosolic iron-sulfur protein assembly protein 1 [Wickerhamiella sorbophila]|uniref:Probable cytosolic iron-sulfur protein assembly protein 1 n=1 Tax=Wickerhamiella sorbophila TaxID=45607 RepID=A0A2T0FJP1_9ASCO|nr:putative cytosolic iron-sulfur protein assembly protein 1 [Wickerhamiella sorbophila]PRT55214.1 putative cytosolic iron-sulfur protein assembly protein 1 [Wickerhamiella sorbophila]